MLNRVHALALAAACFAAACSDHPTAPKTATPPSPSLSRGEGAGAARNADKRAELLTNVPVTGALEGGGTFSGTLTATKITMGTSKSGSSRAWNTVVMKPPLGAQYSALDSFCEIRNPINDQTMAPIRSRRPIGDSSSCSL